MNKSIQIALAVVMPILTTGAAVAQSTNPSAKTPSGQKLSEAQCQTLWSQASAGKASIGEKEAQPYVTTFKSVDSDKDGQLSGKEWTDGCNGGLVLNSANTGAASGDGLSKEQPGQPAPGSKM